MQRAKSDLTVFWSWNGDMNHAEIEEQLRDFHSRGITGVFLHARAGIKIKYMSEEWFSACAKAIEVAEKLNMEIWLYDEDGWPSGFAGGEVPGMGEEYHSGSVNFSDKCPESGKILMRYRKTCEGYALDDAGEDLYAVLSTDSHYVDLLNPSVTDAFIKCTHERYYERFGKYFGGVIKGIFTDEPQLRQPYVYNEYLEHEYNKIYGESLKSQYWRLREEDEQSKAFRYRYNETVAALFCRNYTQKLEKWCASHGILLTGHFAAEDGLCTFSYSGGVMRNYLEMSMPGIDFLGRRLTSPVLCKQLSSVRNQFSKERVLSETFGCSGWNTSFATFAYIWAYQAAQGITSPCLHLSAYTIEGIRKRDYPAFFSYQEPWWDNFKYLSDTMHRMSEFVTDGESMADVLVLSPLTSVKCEPPYSERACALSTRYRALVEDLTDLQVDFDLTDEEILSAHAEIADRKLLLGKAKYDIILVSECDVLLEETALLLENAAAAGIKVLFVNAKPRTVLKESTRISERRSFAQFDALNDRHKLLAKYFEHIGYKRTLAVTGGFSSSLASGLTVYRRKTKEGIRYFILNRSETDAKEAEFSFDCDSASVAYAGESEFRALPLCDGVCTLTLPPMGFVRVIAGTDAKRARAEKCTQAKNLVFDTLVRKEPNVLTLDRARYRYDGGKFSPEMPVIKLQEEIFAHDGELLEVEYSFLADDVPSVASVAAEVGDAESISLNGKKLTAPRGWFIDKSISLFDAASLIKSGENKLNVLYRRGGAAIRSTKEVFETERNRFCYPLSVENAYLVGDFGVKASGKYRKFAGYFTVSGGDFRIVKDAPLSPDGEITTQNMYFYRGAVEYTARVKKQEGRTCLRLGRYDGVIAVLYVNGKEVGASLGNDETDVTPYLKSGENAIAVKLVLSNRNTLGPHHHVRGETAMTGIHIFKGERGFEDDLMSFSASAQSDTWSDSYAFVQGGIGECVIKLYGECK